MIGKVVTGLTGTDAVEQEVAQYINGSVSTIARGSVVVLNTTTNTVSAALVGSTPSLCIGIARDACDPGKVCNVVVRGVVSGVVAAAPAPTDGGYVQRDGTTAGAVSLGGATGTILGWGYGVPSGGFCSIFVERR
jgi:hypothetical protein